jgi:acyl carrier protein
VRKRVGGSGIPGTPEEGYKGGMNMQRSEVMTEVLGVASAVFERPVDGSDNFFDLGGDSVSAIQLVTDLEHRFGTELDIDLLLEAADFAGIAEMIAVGRPN